MALSLADLQAQLDALETARFRGARAVEYDGQKVEYRSDGEMRRAIADLNKRIAALQSSRPVTDIRFTYSKGV